MRECNKNLKDIPEEKENRLLIETQENTTQWQQQEEAKSRQPK